MPRRLLCLLSKSPFSMKSRNPAPFGFKSSIRKSCGLSTALAVSSIQKNSTTDYEDKIPNQSIDFSHRKLIQQACSSSVNSTSELLTQILLAIVDSASNYKNCLYDLINDLEQDIELLGYGTIDPKTADDIIANRVKAKHLKEEFLELITLSEHIEKLAAASAEVSFLTGSETLAILISERLYSVQLKIKNEIEHVQKLENKCLEIQKSSIEDARDSS